MRDEIAMVLVLLLAPCLPGLAWIAASWAFEFVMRGPPPPPDDGDDGVDW